MRNTGITVVDVMRDMKIEITPELSWTVGTAVRELWMQQNGGLLPEKELRTKTSGHGSHCFAVYPESFRGKIEGIVRYYKTEKTRQTSFDF